MFRAALILLLLTGCNNDPTTISELSRVLTTEVATFDAGTVAVNDRKTMTVYLASTGDAPVTVWNVYLEEESEDWVILDTWTNGTTEADDGTILDTLTLEAGSEEAPIYSPVEINFRPHSEGYFHATLIIESNDNEVVETNPDNGHSIWKVVLRGVARYPCLTVYPTFFDFGQHPTGGYWGDYATIENCGTVTALVSSFEITGDDSFTSDTVYPFDVLAGGLETINLAWIATDGSAEGELSLVTNDPEATDTVTLVGNDCSQSESASWDEDGDGWMSCGGDCKDSNPDINPEAVDGRDEDADDKDNDCDGETDEGAGLGADNDGDGYTENDGDCMDSDSTVYPGASETTNQIDDDCDGTIDDSTSWVDDDGDGMSEREGDCDDDDVNTYPGSSEAYDTIDNDCDGNVDEGTYSFDDDEDGYAEVQADGSEGDCDDGDPWTYPGAGEDCDTVDNDCDGTIDEGEDGTENGACSFIVERDLATPKPSTCSSVSGSAGGAALALAVALAGARRRRRQGIA